MKILMVCLGNICRSPIAQGIMQKKIEDLGLTWTVDSAGTSGWHQGEKPDARAIAICKSKNVEIAHQKSRKLVPNDLDDFDIILAMDKNNYDEIIKLCKNTTQRSKVKLILDFANCHTNDIVPDPYYDGKFQEVFELLDKAIFNIVQRQLGVTLSYN